MLGNRYVARSAWNYVRTSATRQTIFRLRWNISNGPSDKEVKARRCLWENCWTGSDNRGESRVLETGLGGWRSEGSGGTACGEKDERRVRRRLRVARSSVWRGRIVSELPPVIVQAIAEMPEVGLLPPPEFQACVETCLGGVKVAELLIASDIGIEGPRANEQHLKRLVSPLDVPLQTALLVLERGCGAA